MTKKIYTQEFFAEANLKRKNKVGGFKDPELARQAGIKGRETQRRKRQAAINNLQHEANKEKPETPKGD